MNQAYAGSAPLLVDTSVDTHRLLLAIRCLIGEEANPVTALLDTAAEWSVLNAELALRLGVLGSTGLPIAMHTRFGRLEGELVTLSLHLLAKTGASVVLDVRWFVCEHWPFPSVIGWRGCLEFLRFGINPDEDRFYFALAEGRSAEHL